RVEGEKIGVAKGEKIGVAKGKIERDLEIALDMLKFGAEVSTVAKYLRKPIDWVENLLPKK
ncbi:MAG: hypothetical protein FWG64_08850, partial [Firmicutes bacterium]|nr:hypothetical protein [Bacillota bacterium]